MELNLPLLIGAAVIDSINPCAFGVLIFLLSYLLSVFKDTRRVLLHGFVYILAVFLTYLAAGLVLLPVLRELGMISTVAYLMIGALVILFGLLQIKDAFWYGRGPTLAILPAAARRIEFYVKRVSQKLSTAFGLGVFVALVELPCTGAVYLAVLSLMSLAGVSLRYAWLLVLYNFLFVLPLIVILLLVAKGKAAHTIEEWRLRHRADMRLLTGLTLIGLGIWMIAYI